MSKKDYEVIATIIREVEHSGEKYYNRFFMLDDMRSRICDYFASDNPKFNRERFLRASTATCGKDHSQLSFCSNCGEISRS